MLAENTLVELQELAIIRIGASLIPSTSQCTSHCIHPTHGVTPPCPVEWSGGSI
jgi:hypothetical protein